MNLKLVLALLVIPPLFFSCNPSTKEQQLASDTFVSDLISKMSLEEKVGQMTQINMGHFYRNDTLQVEKLRKYVVDYGVGSILNTPRNPTAAIPLEEWHEIIRLIQDLSQEAKLKIPVLYGVDAIHGVTYTTNSTLFPHNIGLAASRNLDLARQAAEITAKETRASGIRWNFDPVLDVGREPLWPRFEETFGEDVLLVSEFGTKVIETYEAQNLKDPSSVASCMKHFVGYSMPSSGKDRTPSYIPDYILYDVFLPPFKKAVETGSSTIMINSASINGTPVHISKKLLTDLLKVELGFQGLIVTDWADIHNLYQEHKVAKDNKEAVKLAINAGIDMSMVPGDLSFYEDLVTLVNEGEVRMDRIDDAVYRILKVKSDLGLFENPYPEDEAIKNFSLPEYGQVALEAARESITLVKNDTINSSPILPLDKSAKVLVAGPGANSLATLHGSWSYSWEGKDDSLYPETIPTIANAIANKIGKSNVKVIGETGFGEVPVRHLDLLKFHAASVDYIVLCLGENSYAESPGNIDDLQLSEDQTRLTKAAISTNTPVILILTEGRPRIINGIEEDIDGILLAYRPASRGAEAIADVLFGDYNPNGKLPFSYPRYSGNTICYDEPARIEKYYNPQWPFGHGLSYTTFEFGEIVLSTDTLNDSGTLDVQCTIKNTGQRDGKLAVDLFVRDQVASIIPAMKKLKAFTKVDIAAGAEKEMSFNLTKDDLSFLGQDLKEITEEGEFEVLIGDKKASFYYQK